MAIRILTQNGIDNTNIDGARDNNFNAGRRSGIVKGALKQGEVFSSGNTFTLQTCELRICGHRIVVDDNQTFTYNNIPQQATEQALIAEVTVANNGDVEFKFITQNANETLTQENLDINGTGIYQLEVARFTINTDGNITNSRLTAELITSAGKEVTFNYDETTRTLSIITE